MRNGSPEKNIDISGTDFPAVLKRLRQKHGLTKSELADRTNLTYRTIHDLETARRKRVLEKTLILLADAFDISYTQLLEFSRKSKKEGSWNWRRLLLPAVVVLVLGVIVTCRRISIENSVIQQEDRGIIVRDGLLGLELWSRTFESEINFCVHTPWRGHTVMYGLTSQSEDGGRLVVADAANGSTIWEHRVDPSPLARAFGEEIASSGGFDCGNYRFLDSDGDGIQEVAVLFEHAKYYPAYLCLLDRNGRLRGRYFNRGKIYSLLAEDIDGDGKDEFIAGGTNNGLPYQGGTLILLDEMHWSGASVDSLVRPIETVPDSSLVRIIFPSFSPEVMSLIGAQRLEARNIHFFKNTEGQRRLLVDVGAKEACLTVILDTDLLPLSVDFPDAFRGIVDSWPDSVELESTPADLAYRKAWLEDHRRFGSSPLPYEFTQYPLTVR